MSENVLTFVKYEILKAQLIFASDMREFRDEPIKVAKMLLICVGILTNKLFFLSNPYS